MSIASAGIRPFQRDRSTPIPPAEPGDRILAESDSQGSPGDPKESWAEEELATHITATVPRVTVLIEVTVTDGSPRLAAKVADATVIGAIAFDPGAAFDPERGRLLTRT